MHIFLSIQQLQGCGSGSKEGERRGGGGGGGWEEVERNWKEKKKTMTRAQGCSHW